HFPNGRLSFGNLQDGLTAPTQQTSCHWSYPCVARRKRNFADCDWFQCFLLYDAEKLGWPKMSSQGSAQRAAIRRRRAFFQIAPSKRPFAFGVSPQNFTQLASPTRSPDRKDPH